MIKILTLSLYLLGTTSILFSLVVAQRNTDNEAVSGLMQNVFINAISAANDISAKMLANSARTMNNLEDNISMLTTSTINQLIQPMEDLQKEIQNSQCQPLTTIEQLRKQIDSDLLQCKENFDNILKNLQQLTTEFEVALENRIKEIINLHKKCESVKGFDSIITCYAGLISDFNEDVRIIFHNAGETFLQLRQLDKQAVQESHICANNVVATAKDSIKEILTSCQLIKKENIA